MKITGKKVVARVAAGAALLAASSVVACTTTEADPMPAPSTGGTPSVLPGGGSSGAANTSGASGASTGGGGAGMMGGAGGGTAVMCAGMACKVGQQCIMEMCACPGYAPNYCDADSKCANFTKDPDHCGDCATKCGPTAACTASACTPEPAALGTEIAGCGTLKLQLAAGKIYALSTMTGNLDSIDPATGAATPITTGITGATAFVVNATDAYVAAGMKIVKVALAGGVKTDVAITPAETAVIHDVAVDGTTLYYATGKDVKSAPAAGGASEAVAIGIDEGEPQGVAFSAGHVLYGSNSAMNVESCDVTMECHMTELMPGAGHVKIGASQGGLIFGHRSVQADATKVYWVNNGIQGAAFAGADHGALGIPPKDGGKITAFAVAADGTAYYADEDQNFQKGKPGDADPIWLARQVGMVSSLVVDTTSAYLASGCKILKAPL